MREKRGIQKIESSNSRRKLLVREATGALVGPLWTGLIVVFVPVLAVVDTHRAVSSAAVVALLLDCADIEERKTLGWEPKTQSNSDRKSNIGNKRKSRNTNQKLGRIQTVIETPTRIISWMGRESGLFVDGDCDGVVDIDHDAAVAITMSKALLLQLVLLYLCPLFTLRVMCVCVAHVWWIVGIASVIVVVVILHAVCM